MTEKQSAIVICMTKSYFKDDVEGKCGDCGETVYRRPHYTEFSIVKLLCQECAMKLPKDSKFMFTEKGVKDALEYISRQRRYNSAS